MLRWIVFLSCLAAPLHADLVYNSVPVTIDAVGAICDAPPDEVLAAPGTTSGSIDHTFSRKVYVVQGDRLVVGLRVGISLKVHIPSLEPSEKVILRIDYPDGQPSRWEARVPGDRRLEFASLPVIGDVLRPGRYRFSVQRAGRSLSTYDIHVTGQGADDLCLVETS